MHGNDFSSILSSHALIVVKGPQSNENLDLQEQPNQEYKEVESQNNNPTTLHEKKDPSPRAANVSAKTSR